MSANQQQQKTRCKQEEEELRMQMLLQQQHAREQLQLLQQQQFSQLLQQQQLVHGMRSFDGRHQQPIRIAPAPSSSPPPPTPPLATVSSSIATLKDALSYPGQPPQLAPLAPRPSSSFASDSSRSSDSNTSLILSIKGANKSGKSERKKFPRGLSRFRDRLQHLEERLTLDVNALRQEIRDLELRRGLMETRTLTTRFSVTGSAAKIVREYFVTFHDGHQIIPDAIDISSGGRNATHRYNPIGVHKSAASSQAASKLQWQLETATRQNAFYEGLVDPQMGYRKYIGRDVLKEQWVRYSGCHEGLRMELFTITTASTRDHDGPSNDEEDDDGMNGASAAKTVVHTTGQLTAYITQQTLEHIFPNALRNPALAQRLIGKYIEYPLSIEFHVNAAGKITKYDADVDFFAGLSKVLGNLSDVALLMRDALISDYCVIGSLDAFQQLSVDDDGNDSHQDKGYASSDGMPGSPQASDVQMDVESDDSTDFKGSNNKAALDYILS